MRIECDFGKTDAGRMADGLEFAGHGDGSDEIGQAVEVARRDPLLLPLGEKLGRGVFHEGAKSILQMNPPPKSSAYLSHSTLE